MVSTAFASALGGLLTFFEIIGSALLGFFILANFRYGLLSSFELLKNQKITQEEFSALNLLSAIGAILLIIPGFLSDIVGIICQISFLSAPIGNLLLKNRFVKKEHKHRKYDEVIDVEVIEK